MSQKKSALGRGLSALIDDSKYESKEQEVVQVQAINEILLSNISVNPFQPRRNFDEEALLELSLSIKELGVIVPITVRAMGENKYQLISGERRFRASTLAGLTSIPAYVREADDQGMIEMALVENIQREDLNPIEIAISYQRLIDECKLTQDEMSERVGKNRSTVSNFLRLLKLPAEIQVGLRDNRIAMTHARALSSLTNPLMQLKLYFQIVNEGLSVRKIEELVRIYNNPPEPVSKNNPKSILAEHYQTFRDSLQKHFKTKVNFERAENGRGKITIPFKSDEELTFIMGLMENLNKKEENVSENHDNNEYNQ